MNTLKLLLDRYKLQLMGATGDAGKVSANGRIYEDGMAYAIIKNETGRVKAYKENIYTPVEGVRLLASKTDKSRYYIGELNGRSAKQVYMELTHCSEKEIENQTFTNPLGKMIGDDICIVSLKGVEGSGITCYRQVNDSDILTLLQMNDPMEIAQNTVAMIAMNRYRQRATSAARMPTTVIRRIRMARGTTQRNRSPNRSKVGLAVNLLAAAAKGRSVPRDSMRKPRTSIPAREMRNA
jgi:hypothetical protein